MEEGFATSFCEAEFARIGLRFWTGDEVDTESMDIHTAASIGVAEFMKTFPHEELDRPNWGSWTPLMYASYLGHRKLTLLLISQGCDLCKANQEGRTPLMLGAMCGNVDIVKDIVLTKVPRILQQTDKRNFTALSHAVYGGHVTVAEYLLSVGASPNTTEHEKGFSLVMLAAAQGNLEMVDVLLEGGADLTYQNAVGDTAVSIAQALGHQTVVKAIRQHQYAKHEAVSALDGPAKAELLMQKRLLEDSATMTIDVFLSKLGLSNYIQLFRDQEIDFQLLLSLTDEDFKQLGVTLLGPRRKLTSAISRWKTRPASSLQTEEGKIIM